MGTQGHERWILIEETQEGKIKETQEGSEEGVVFNLGFEE